MEGGVSDKETPVSRYRLLDGPAFDAALIKLREGLLHDLAPAYRERDRFHQALKDALAIIEQYQALLADARAEIETLKRRK
jgi:hypothetical protein